MINQTGVAESGTSRWERIPAWSNRDLMLAASMNLPGVKAMPRSGGLSLVGRGCLLTVHTWILRHNRGLIGVGLHSDTFLGWEITMFYFFFFFYMHNKKKIKSFVNHSLGVSFFFHLLCQFLQTQQPLCSFMVAITVHNYFVLALCNTNKQLKQKKDHLYAKRFIMGKAQPDSGCLQYRTASLYVDGRGCIIFFVIRPWRGKKTTRTQNKKNASEHLGSFI